MGRSCFEIEGRPTYIIVNQTIQSSFIKQSLFPKSSSGFRSHLRTCKDTSLTLHATGAHLRLSPLEKNASVFRPNAEPRGLRARGARRGGGFGSPPGEAHRSSLRNFDFPRHKSPGYLIFCTVFQRGQFYGVLGSELRMTKVNCRFIS